MEKQGKVCTKCREWKILEEYNKFKHSKDGRKSVCRECQKEQNKQWRENNKEYCKEYAKQWGEINKEYRKEYIKQWEENNKEHIKEYHKQHYQNNKEQIKEYNKQWKENNKEHKKEYDKQWRESNKEHKKEYDKQWRENNKENNLQYISDIVEQVNPIMKELPIYGYIYLFTNIKTGHHYVGQSTLQLKTRYGYEGGIIKSWIKERLKYNNQKFKDELIEEDIEVTEVFDVAFCQYHLDKLEAYWINYYDSCDNGYNNEYGNHNTTDGLDEFNEILKTYNLQYIDGKLIKAPTIK